MLSQIESSLDGLSRSERKVAAYVLADASGFFQCRLHVWRGG